MFTILRGNEEGVPLEWVRLCATTDVRSGQSHVFDLGGQSLLLCHSAAGFALIENLCTHKALSLERGRLIGNEIICPHHGARFCLVDGRPISGAIRPLKTYEVATVNGEVRARLPIKWFETSTD
jgi:3-phenylpropionate/trans-cinnamate dioxygenase ferredoxin subunit